MDRLDPSSIVASAMTVSDKIRALDKAGFRKSEIADLLGKRYQHVRNVLVNDARRAGSRSLSETGRPNAATRGMSEDAREFTGQLHVRSAETLVWVDVEADGLVRLPEAAKAALELNGGGPVLVQVGPDGSVNLLSPQAAIRQARAIVRAYVPPGVSLVDELLAERREEARRENESG
jgi:hypothetical protein